MHRFRSSRAFTFLLAGSCCATSLACGSDARQSVASERAELHARSPDELWHDKTLEEWAVEYVRWYYSATDCDGFPTEDVDGSLCGNYQDPESPVFFFERSSFGEGPATVFDRDRCQVPLHKAILVPVASFFGDNAGMEDPWPDEELESTMAEVKSTMRNLELRADGRAIDNLEAQVLGPIRFDYYVPRAPNRYGCDDTSGVSDVLVSPSFLVGHFVLFDPPAAGQHQIEYASTLTYSRHDFSFHVRSKFNVAEVAK